MRLNRLKIHTEMWKKDLSVTALAEMSGITRATLSAVRGGKSCTYETAEKIAKALNVPVQDLLEQ